MGIFARHLVYILHGYVFTVCRIYIVHVEPLPLKCHMISNILGKYNHDLPIKKHNENMIII